MAGGPAGFRQGFSCPALLDKTCIRSASFSRTRLSRSLVNHSSYSANHADFLPYPVSDSCWSQIRYLEINFKFSDLVSCNITTPFRHWSINRICLRTDKNLKGLGSTSFARHYSRYRYLLSLPQPTKMFQFSWFPSKLPIYSGASNMSLHMLGFPIRTFPDQSLLTAPRDLSQSSTSFIGNIRLGILSMLLSTFLCIDLTSNW